MGLRKKTGNKTVPYLSQEFFIQNHGDIATCICMVFIIGLMFQVTSPLASVFIAPKHNLTEINYTSESPVLYTYGSKDLCLLFFYTITAIIFHAIIQEYVLDKLMRKVRLSKTKSSKFNESGQLFAFYLLSSFWALSVFREDTNFRSLSFLWTGYPHVGLTFLSKFFFIIQISYWIHTFPELYLQRIRKEEIPQKVTFALANLFISASIYLLNLSRVGLVLLFIDHSVNALFHLSRVLYFSGKNKVSTTCFRVYNFLFVLARLAAIVLSIFVFWFGLKSSSVDKINFQEGNFNTALTRLTCLFVILTLQALMLWNFILFQCKKIRENSKTSPSKTVTRPMTRQQKAVKTETSDSELEKEPTTVEAKKAN